MSTALVSGVLLAALLPALPAAAKGYQPPRAPKERAVAVQKAPRVATPTAVTGRPFVAKAPVWPAPSTVEVEVGPTGEAVNTPGLLVSVASPETRVAGSPASASAAAAPPPSRVRVTTFNQADTKAAGVVGVLLRVGRTDGESRPGKARVTVDYASFADAFGADWASRLRMTVLPSCFLSTPGRPECQGKPVASTNDVARRTVSADVDVAPAPVTSGAVRALAKSATAGTLLAVSAGPSGPAGDYAATSLAPSATWSAGGNAGDFSWSYPMRVPPSLGGPSPSLALSYSSASVDGRMAASNNQPSEVGQGFESSQGFIERKYRACADDMGAGANNTAKTGDQCWVNDNATISMAGHAGELIKDGSNPNRFHLRADDGTFVEWRSGAANGARNGEHWVVTTTDGVQYWFGRSAQSTLAAPVFGNHASEPCHAAAFKDSSCTMAYRWNLDYVVDLHNNTMTYTYSKETNKYARNANPTDLAEYDRASSLQKIEYGTRGDRSGEAPMQVVFTTADRCLFDCGRHGANWPDTPWEQACTASPCLTGSPTFWTTRRLTGVTTKVWGGSGYRDVESWSLSQSFPDPGDTTRAGLWLDKISHQGLVGAATAVPDVLFAGVQLRNRVNAHDDHPTMNWWRIKTITTETGAKIDVNYSAPDCVPGSRMPNVNALQDNNLRCYPVKWTPPGQTSPIIDFFHKYVITDVVEDDLTGGASRVLTHYDYDPAGPAWHYTDDDGLIKPADKTWSVWRGYASVRATSGDAGEQTSTETRYFRGMNGDHLPSGSRSVSLPAIAVGNVPAAVDEDAFAGMTREQIVYNGPGGAEVSATVSQPWRSDPTASRTINGVTVSARFANTAASHSRTALDGGRGFRTTTGRTTFDGYGMTVASESGGDDSVAGDEKCALTDYVRNTGAWVLSTTSRTRAFAVDCAKARAGGLTDDDVISDTLTSYDGQGFGAAPSKGDVTRTESLKAYNAGNPTYLTTAQASYDAYGRPLDTWDVRNNKSSVAYTPAAGGPVTMTTATNPLGWVSKTTIEPAWGLPTATVDPNNRRTHQAYDGLGRLTGVWKPGRATSQSPTISYEYLVRNTAVSAVTTKTLTPNGGYATSYTLYDSLLRPRQTQSSDSAGGANAVISDTYYDTAGRAAKTHHPFLAKEWAPKTELAKSEEVIPSQTVTVFDGASRPVASILQVNAAPNSAGGTEKWRTTTSYGGDHTDTTPPAGGTATSTITDAAGRTTTLRQYHAGTPTGAYDATVYTYNRKDQLTTITDPVGNHWDYTYDLQGRKVTTSDPDKGSSTSIYNDFGDLSATTDARQNTLAYTYDAIGRKSTVRDGTATGPKRTEWIYDTLASGRSVKGQLIKSIRYSGAAGDAYVKEIGGFTIDYQPSSIFYKIPMFEAGLGGSYEYNFTYKPTNFPETTDIPAIGDLQAETLIAGYDSLGKPATVRSGYGIGGEADLVTKTQYTSFGELAGVHLRNDGGNPVAVMRQYEEDTRRLSRIWTSKQTAPTTVADVSYGYDPAGNVTKVADTGTGTAADTQCFGYDYLRRLTQAWTPGGGDCAVAPTVAGLGGPAKYWTSWQFDTVGNRTSQVEHATPAGVRTTDYTVPAAMQPRPHSLTGTTTTDNAGVRTAGYEYDNTGNTMTRPGATGSQTLTWDAEGHLAKVTDGSGSTEFVYDADGQRLLRRDPAGKTLYLPGQELRSNTAGAAKVGTRYYSHAGTTIATRTGSGLTWLAGDHHGTTSVTIDAVSQATAVRRQDPYGLPRGAVTGAWPAAMDKGFVGGTNDNTGMTHLGAREYDPTTGRFISVDPIMDIEDPQQWNGYAYANSTPVTSSDSSGLFVCVSCGLYLAKARDKAVNWIWSGYHESKTATRDSNGDGVTTLGDVVANGACPYGGIGPGCGQHANETLREWGDAFGEVFGVNDIMRCAQGNTASCAWAAAGLVAGPVGRGAVAGGKLAARNVKRVNGTVKAVDNVPTPRIAPHRGAAAAGCNSFDPDTPVLMADGTPKPIKDVKVGDQVTVTDPQTSQTTARHVTMLHYNLDADLTDIQIRDQDGTTTTLHTTQHHRFWSVDRHQWVNAEDLQPGERLRTTNAGTRTVIKVKSFIGAKYMNDLTVADIHTYYVMAGTTPVLVHNCNTIRARDVRFTQNSIRSEFKDGSGSIADTANGLADGSIDPASIPAIKIFKRGDQIFSLDNRRLFAGQYADVDLPFEWATKADIAKRRMTYVDDGLSIKVRSVGWWSNY